jgi:hypothetical protein
MSRYARPVLVAVTIVLLAIAVFELWMFWGYIDSQRALGTDLNYYKFIAQRWLDTGVWYTDRQLAGPYVQQTLVDNLYPPHALYLFLPFVFVPFPLWWLIPAGLVAYSIWVLRPAVWSWPILALILALPKTPVSILFGNSDLLVLAFVAAGVVWGWPAVLASFKPSMGVFAFVGMFRRSWWFGVVALAFLTLPQIQLWLLWPQAIRNSSAVTIEYSLANYPFMLLPIVVRLASTTRGPVRLPAMLQRARLRLSPSRP